MSLFSKVEADDIEGVKNLLNQGANINSKNEKGWTPLLLACLYTDPDGNKMAKFLLENGANVNCKSTYGFTSLMISTQYSKSKSDLGTVRLLLENGADVNIINVFGDTALTMAGQSFGYTSNINTIKLLLEYGADVNSKSHFGRTCLKSIIQSKRSDTKILKLLLDYGADPLDKSKGKFVYNYCTRPDFIKIISKRIWHIIHINIKKLSSQFAKQTILLRELWEIILLRHKFNQLKNKEIREIYILKQMVEYLGIYINSELPYNKLLILIDKQISKSEIAIK